MAKRDRRPQVNHARRHFLGLAAAASAVLGSLIAAAIPSKAEAVGRAWWKHGHPGRGNGHGRDKPHGGPLCLLRGTAIATPKGDIRIEDLRIGDLVETMSGTALPIKWIGHHVYRRNRPTWSKEVTPIRIARFALDDHTPRNDLYLTAGHAVFIDGMLIRARDLLNGTSITRIPPADQDTIEYFHVVLESHQVILAEGAPVETCLLEAYNYEAFTNFAEFARLYPADRHANMPPFAPYVGYGGSEHLKALLYLAAGRPTRTGSPLHVACNRIAERGARLLRSEL